MALKQILVVDNHPLILSFMTDLLGKKGHTVLTAKDGLSALEILGHTTPEVIFIDLIMPNIDGRKLCRIIRSIPELKQVKLVILSGIAAEDGVDLAELEADACIAKGPIDRMGKHVLDALSRLYQDDATQSISIIKGLQGIRSREITRELLSEKKHLEVILESLAEGILEITAEGSIVYANTAALALTAQPEQKLLATNFINLFSETERIRIQALFDGNGVRQEAHDKEPLVSLKGRSLEIKVLPLAGEEPKSVVILNDVSEQKLREAQLRQAQKMESIGTIAAGIAHDFNNLLMGIQGYVSLMILSTDSANPFFDMLKGIEKQVQRGSTLTRQLLAYARKGQYKLKTLDLNRLIKETSETFGRTKKEITIHLRLDAKISAVEADQDQIEQTLFNLYVNAADAMPGGGDLYLQTRNSTHEEIKNNLYETKPGRYVQLTVSDTGTGMDRQVMAKVFDPFFTTKEMGKGTGLGLASAYGIVKGHGGYIEVDSEKGIGTTFRIYLPASGNITKTTGGSIPKKASGAAMTNGTILLVDDEEIIRKVGKQMLEAMGYRVRTCADGFEALEIYKSFQNSIDLVLLDMVMPKMGGGTVFDRLRAIDPNVNVILSSGFSIDGEATEIMKRGCNGFIQKPFSMDELNQEIKRTLNINPVMTIDSHVLSKQA